MDIDEIRNKLREVADKQFKIKNRLIKIRALNSRKKQFVEHLDLLNRNISYIDKQIAKLEREVEKLEIEQSENALTLDLNTGNISVLNKNKQEILRL
jgi:hypothetical protein